MVSPRRTKLTCRLRSCQGHRNLLAFPGIWAFLCTHLGLLCTLSLKARHAPSERLFKEKLMCNFLQGETRNPEEEGSAWVGGLSASLPSLGMSGSTGTAAHTLLLLLLAPVWVCTYGCLRSGCCSFLFCACDALGMAAHQWGCRHSPGGAHTAALCRMPEGGRAHFAELKASPAVEEGGR